MLIRLLSFTVLLFGVLQLGARGAQRFRSDLPLWDFGSVYASARAWTHGLDPYSLADAQVTWQAAGTFADRDISYWSTVYPPTSLVLMLPFAVLPSSVAMIAWVAFTIALLALQFACLFDLGRFKWSSNRAIFLVGATLASAPMQFGLLSGQITVPVVSMCIIAVWCERRRGFTAWGNPLAGILIGLACAMKPQLAAPFLAYYLVINRKQPIIAGLAMMVLGIVTATALLAMKMTHIDWFAGWTGSIAATTQAGGVNDYDFTGPYRDQIVDLKMVVIGFVRDPKASMVVVECIFLALAAWFLRALPSSRSLGTQRAGGLLPLVALISISLLPIYHRVYDAVLLSLGLAWVLSEWNSRRRWLALTAFAPAILFLVPFDILRAVTHRISFAGQISEGRFWRTIVEPHYAWAMFAVTLGSLYVMNRIAAANPAVVTSTKPATPGALAEVDTDEDDEAMLAH